MGPDTIGALCYLMPGLTKKEVTKTIIDGLVDSFRFELETIFGEETIERLKQPLPNDSSEE